ncbi:MAG: hypothetical protein HY301_05025 [Verrucomicrobia bacterium]|nr:hypothetical protein [Verrucomicrobiota bacterium]
MKNNDQIELSFNSNQAACPSVRRIRRAERASWWFARMREVVAQATDWSQPPAARPEQIALPLGAKN